MPRLYAIDNVAEEIEQEHDDDTGHLDLCVSCSSDIQGQWDTDVDAYQVIVFENEIGHSYQCSMCNKELNSSNF